MGSTDGYVQIICSKTDELQTKRLLCWKNRKKTHCPPEKKLDKVDTTAYSDFY